MSEKAAAATQLQNRSIPSPLLFVSLRTISFLASFLSQLTCDTFARTCSCYTFKSQLKQERGPCLSLSSFLLFCLLVDGLGSAKEVTKMTKLNWVRYP